MKSCKLLVKTELPIKRTDKYNVCILCAISHKTAFGSKKSCLEKVSTKRIIALELPVFPVT